VQLQPAAHTSLLVIEHTSRRAGPVWSGVSERNCADHDVTEVQGEQREAGWLALV
jgi:hypothetical protein